MNSQNNKPHACRCFMKSVAFLLIIMMVLIPLSALAAVDMQYQYQSEILTVSGTVTVPYGTVTVFVAPSSVDLSTCTAEMANSEKYAVKAVKADMNGNYSVIIELPVWFRSGEYALYVSDGSETKNATFTHLNMERARIALNGNDTQRGINSANSASDLKALLISGLAEDLGLATVTEELASGIYVGIPKGGYTIESFLEELNRIRAILLIQSSEDIDTAEAYIVNYAKSFGLDFEKDYSDCSDALKLGFLNKLKTYSLQQTPAYNIFFESLVGAAVSDLTSVANAREVIEKFADNTQLDFTYYEKLTDYQKNSVISNLISAEPTEFESLSDFFYRNSKKIYDDSQKSSSGGSIGGSSSKKSSSTGFEVRGDLNSAIAQAVVEEKPKFTDISGHWAQSRIESLAQEGIVSGFQDGSFQPDENVTRAEFAKLISLAFKLEKSVGNCFADVSETDWYYPYVYAAYQAELIEGFEGKFNPQEKITREDCAVILHRFLVRKGKTFETGESFSDSSDIADYALEAVNALSGAKLINGNNNQFLPNNCTTRAEAVTLLYNILMEI